jgi:hypothetical protein
MSDIRLDHFDYRRQGASLFVSCSFACPWSQPTDSVEADVSEALTQETLASLSARAEVTRYRDLLAKLRDAETELVPAESLAAKSREELSAELTASNLSGVALTRALTKKEKDRQAAVAKLDSCKEGLAVLRAAVTKAKAEASQLIAGYVALAVRQGIEKAEADKKDGYTDAVRAFAESEGLAANVAAVERSNFLRMFAANSQALQASILARLDAPEALPESEALVSEVVVGSADRVPCA